MGNLVIRFSVHLAEVKGEVVAGHNDRKIVFVAGYRPETAVRYRGLLPKNGEIWVCAFERDTQPGGQRGAFIVRPLRQVQYGLREVGEPIEGARRVEAFCLDAPELGDYVVPQVLRQEAEEKSAPYRAALAVQKARASRWSGPIGEQFFAEFGKPDSLRVGSYQDSVSLVYAHGEKAVSVEEAARFWQTEPTGEWRCCEHDWSGKSLEAQFVFEAIPGACFWRTFARGLSDGRVTLSPEFDSLPATTQAEALVVLRAAVLTPEAVAEANWLLVINGRPGYGEGSVDRRLREIVALQAGRADLLIYEQEEDIHYGESDDGYRPAGSYRGRVTRYALRVGGRPDRWGNIVGGQKFDVGGGGKSGEEVRSSLVAQKRACLWQALNSYAKGCRAPTMDSRLGTLEPAVWVERYEARYASLLTHAVKAWVMEEVSAISAERAESRRYETACVEVKALREQAGKISARASRVRVEIGLELPRWHDELSATASQLEAEVVAWHEWIAQAPAVAAKAVADRLAKFEAKAKRAEKRAIEAQVQSEDEYGVSGRLLDYGRDLALALAGRLGKAEAIATLTAIRQAPYGYGGKKRDVEDAFRGSVPEKVAEGVGMVGRARDLDVVLESASRSLGGLTAPLAPEETVVAIVVPSVAFKDEGKRWFRCQCGSTVQVAKGDWQAYQAGQELTLICSSGCGGIGTVKK